MKRWQLLFLVSVLFSVTGFLFPFIASGQQAAGVQVAQTRKVSLINQFASERNQATIYLSGSYSVPLVPGGGAILVNLNGKGLEQISSAVILLNGKPVREVEARLSLPSSTNMRELTLVARSTAILSSNYSLQINLGQKALTLPATLFNLQVAKAEAVQGRLQQMATMREGGSKGTGGETQGSQPTGPGSIDQMAKGQTFQDQVGRLQDPISKQAGIGEMPEERAKEAGLPGQKVTQQMKDSTGMSSLQLGGGRPSQEDAKKTGTGQDPSQGALGDPRISQGGAGAIIGTGSTGAASGAGAAGSRGGPGVSGTTARTGSTGASSGAGEVADTFVVGEAQYEKEDSSGKSTNVLFQYYHSLITGKTWTCLTTKSSDGTVTIVVSVRDKNGNTTSETSTTRSGGDPRTTPMPDGGAVRAKPSGEYDYLRGRGPEVVIPTAKDPDPDSTSPASDPSKAKGGFSGTFPSKGNIDPVPEGSSGKSGSSVSRPGTGTEPRPTGDIILKGDPFELGPTKSGTIPGKEPPKGTQPTN